MRTDEQTRQRERSLFAILRRRLKEVKRTNPPNNAHLCEQRHWKTFIEPLSTINDRTHYTRNPYFKQVFLGHHTKISAHRMRSTEDILRELQNPKLGRYFTLWLRQSRFLKRPYNNEEMSLLTDKEAYKIWKVRNAELCTKLDKLRKNDWYNDPSTTKLTVR